LIIQPGQILSKSATIVYAGEVDVSLPDETGSQQLIASLERGAFFGEMSILSREPAVANVTASLDSKIVKVPRAAIRFSIKKVVSKD
jgi:CRP-like cAMP-binding protein